MLTSGGTESNNHALRGLLKGSPKENHLVVSSIEHPSIAELANQLEREGVAIDRLAADANGVVLVDQLAGLLRDNTRLVSVMLGNNETGALQPLEEVVSVCSQRGVPVHTDATQVVGKLPVDFQKLGVAMLTFAAHKFHGPVGIGGLLVRRGMRLAPLLSGQAESIRPGTPCVTLAIGMARALELLHDNPYRAGALARLRDRLEALVTAEDPQTVIVSQATERLPHTSCLAFVGLDRQALHMALDRQGVECSTGSACASGSGEPSPALLAMGLPEELIQGAVRFSLGATTTEREVDEAAQRILLTCSRLRQRKDS